MRQQMTYQERERLKRFAQRGECVAQALRMVAAFHAQTVELNFSEYAAQWAAAEQIDEVAAMRAFWPLRAPRKIADNCDEWGSFGNANYRD